METCQNQFMVRAFFFIYTAVAGCTACKPIFRQSLAVALIDEEMLGNRARVFYRSLQVEPGKVSTTRPTTSNYWFLPCGNNTVRLVGTRCRIRTWDRNGARWTLQDKGEIQCGALGYCRTACATARHGENDIRIQLLNGCYELQVWLFIVTTGEQCWRVSHRF